MYRCGFTSELSILFHWSMYLSLCPHHAVFITLNNKPYSSKPITSHMVLHCQYCSNSSSSFAFHVNVWILLAVSIKNTAGILIGKVLSLQINLRRMDTMALYLLTSFSFLSPTLLNIYQFLDTFCWVYTEVFYVGGVILNGTTSLILDPLVHC